MAYATYSDFEQFFEGFGTNYYGTFVQQAGTNAIDLTGWQSAIDSSYNRINTMLDSVDKVPITPIGTNPKSGVYHPNLIEWNCCDVIFIKLRSRHAREFNNMLPDWMSSFGSRCMQILDSISCGNIALDTDTTNSGIGYAQRVVGTNSKANFYTNWDSGFYQGSDFAKTYRVKISGTTGGNEIGQAQFLYSLDDGYSYVAATYSTTKEWSDLGYGVNVRWSPGTLTGTQVQLDYGDTWKFDVIPQNVRKQNGAITYRRYGLE